MHLSFVTSNILHQVLDEEINIVYNPVSNIFDKILFATGNNFFVFGDYNPHSENCVSYSNEYIDLRNYDLYLHTGIATSNTSTIPLTLHANMVIFEHNFRDANLKKEDLAILNQRTQKYKKIFFNEQHQNSWGLTNSTTINYGIPEIFKSDIDYKERKNILINSKKNPQAADQLKDHLESQGLICGLLDDRQSLDQMNVQLNNYQILINLDDDHLLNLIAAQCGCYVQRVSNNPEDIPNNFKYNDIPSLVQDVPNIITKEDNNLDSINKYIDEKHNFNLFKIKISDIIESSAKREAFIL